ncbi:efflux RND transporter periplasmic adaptor subunit [Hippea alviniae]|uniref:efflux RND transporter periplasmic adaptor subunit n=1 Tax=Hippea alviniae TaxID=1279027 RepID=UPI0003B3CD24|nr:RND transporter [Hippea alviniae]
MRRFVVITVVVLLVVSLAFLVRLRKKELESLKPPKIYPVVVKTITPKKSSFYLTLTGLGIIQSSANVNITTNLAGRVLYVKNLGDRVKKGDIVAKIDATSVKSKLNSAYSKLKSLKSKLNSAEISLKNAILSHNRSRQLLKVKGVSIEQYQKEESQIALLKSNIASIKSEIKGVRNSIRELKNLLSYAVLKSPIDGVISKKFLNVGDMVLPSRPIVEVSSNKGKYLMVMLPSDIKPKGVIFDGKFYELFALNSTFNGLDEYKANIDTNLAAGSKVKVSVVVFKGKAVKLPFDAVLNDNGKNIVFIFKNDRAIPKPVHILASGEEGLAVSDTSIVGKQLIVAKPDIFVRLLGGVKVVKE